MWRKKRKVKKVMDAKRKYTRREVKPVEEEFVAPQEVESEPEPEPEPLPPPVVVEEEKPPVEQKVVLCECGNPANPGDHQCWRCSHRT
jgi:hypothetical protein